MNHVFTCLIVDDEQDAIDLLCARLRLLYDKIDIIGTYTTWEAAINALRNQKADVLFMDVSMPGKTGIDLLRLLPGMESEIIFITAYEEYALVAFQFAASGYILKPIDDHELLAAVNVAIERNQNKKLAKYHSATGHSAKIGIPNAKGVDYIDMPDIQYFETVNGYTKVVTKDLDLLSSFSIGKFKPLLDARYFYQVHRSYIVNLNYIRKYQSNGEVVMSNNKEIPVSKNLRDEFLNLFHTVTNK
jgi:two-component system LytT family response regulator